MIICNYYLTTIVFGKVPNNFLPIDAFFKRWVLGSMNNIALAILKGIVTQRTCVHRFIIHEVATFINILTCPLAALQTFYVL